MNTDKLVFGLLIIVYCTTAALAINKSTDARRNKATQSNQQLTPSALQAKNIAGK